jgi:hypothetical protein
MNAWIVLIYVRYLRKHAFIPKIKLAVVSGFRRWKLKKDRKKEMFQR